MNRADTRNAILKGRFDARSQARQPVLRDTRDEQAVMLKHNQLLANLEQTRQRLIILGEQVRGRVA